MYWILLYPWLYIYLSYHYCGESDIKVLSPALAPSTPGSTSQVHPEEDQLVHTAQFLSTAQSSRQLVQHRDGRRVTHAACLRGRVPQVHHPSGRGAHHGRLHPRRSRHGLRWVRPEPRGLAHRLHGHPGYPGNSHYAQESPARKKHLALDYY